MPKSYFVMDVNAAAESWRSIRSMRAQPPAALQQTLRGDRLRVFQSALEQAQQQFGAAALVGYESRPLNLFYGLAQAGRAIAAASAELYANQTDEARRLWKASGHGLSFPDTISGQRTLFEEGVTVSKGGRKDLFSRVSIALNSPLDVGLAVLEDVLVQIPEFRLEFGATATAFPDLHEHGIYAGGSLGAPPYEWEVWLPGIPISGPISEDAVRERIARYPALREMTVVVDDNGQVRRSHNPGRIYLEVPRPELLKRGFSSNYLPVGAVMYRHHPLIFPTVGQASQALAPLMSWWLVLYALSMLARYSPSDWTNALSLDTSPISSKIEHVLDSAIDAVPELIAESLGTLNT